MKYPFYGYRRITAILNRSGYHVNDKKIRRIMKLMDLPAIYPKKKTTFANKEHKIYPYLLRDLIINKSDQVWATDITYIKMSKGFVYLVVLIDLFSRNIINWQLSTTMEKEFCIEMQYDRRIESATTMHNHAQPCAHALSLSLRACSLGKCACGHVRRLRK